MREIEFAVEQAGCPSCAARLRRAFETIATIDAIEIDEKADAAAVRLRSPDPISEASIGKLLSEVAAGSGHEYRVQPGSWRALPA